MLEVFTWDFLVGMVVFLLMSLVNTPPRVSIPSERGVLIYEHLYLGLLSGDGGVPVDELGEHSTQGLNTQGEGSPNIRTSLPGTSWWGWWCSC
jgi:hypothetical protein